MSSLFIYELSHCLTKSQKFPWKFFLNFTFNNVSLFPRSQSPTHCLFQGFPSEVTSTSPRLSYSFIWPRNTISGLGGNDHCGYNEGITRLSYHTLWRWALVELLMQTLWGLGPSTDLCFHLQSGLLPQLLLLSIIQLPELPSVFWICYSLCFNSIANNGTCLYG